MSTATLRFYQELKQLLSSAPDTGMVVHHFIGHPAVKDAIEACGVPHTEVDLILVNGASVDFEHPLSEGDRVSVYPVFEALDVRSVTRVREEPLRVVKFVLDVHLGTLARRLRMLGFDTTYESYYTDPEIAEIARKEHRIVLTRDQGLLKRKVVTHGYWVRSQDPEAQVIEVLRRFDLALRVRPFRRCIACNGKIVPVEKGVIEAQLKPGTRREFDEFYQCRRCGRIYWKGSHYEKMLRSIREIMRAV